MIEGKKTKIAILGGYGNTGLRVAKHLAKSGGFEVVLLGRNGERARKEAEKLTRAGVQGVTGGVADASRPDTLKRALTGMDIVLSATSDTNSAPKVMRAAFELGIDYMDCHLSTPFKWAALRALESAVVKKGLCFITDGGLHPGVPAAMVRAAAKDVKIESADIYGTFNLNWAALSFGQNAAEDFISELRDMDPSVLVKGKWFRDWKNTSSHDFGDPYGEKKCIAMNFEEMKSLPALIPSLRYGGFYIGGFGFKIDNIIMPLCLAILWLSPKRVKLAGSLLFWALTHWKTPGQWAIIDLDAAGTKDDKQVPVKMRLFHEDPYELTALAIVCCLEQYQSEAKRPGAFAQALYVNPDTFLKALEAKGVKVAIDLGRTTAG